MRVVELGYGKSFINFEYDENQFEILEKKQKSLVLSDFEINTRLDSPVFSDPLEDTIGPEESVLIVVPDSTRKAACGRVLNLLVRRLIASGIKPHRMGIIFATGIHRPVTEEEKKEIITPFIYQRIKTFNHSAKDLMMLAGAGSSFIDFGLTSNGIRVKLNRLLREYDHIVLIGGVTFHYFAGFTGGRKLICPGLASEDTISETHKLAFDFGRKTRRLGVGTGILKGNIVHETFVEIASKVNPSFSVNTIVNEKGEPVEIFCGHWRLAHERTCESYAERHTIRIQEKRDIVIVSCGGFPFDLNMIQAHKALEAASYSCREGGTIVLVAECSDGLGRKDFLKWFETDSEKLAERLCNDYQVNGQTAWSFLRKTERFNVKIITALDGETCQKMKMEKIMNLNFLSVSKDIKGYILPHGARFLVDLNSSV